MAFLGRDASVWPGAVIRGDVNSISIGAATNIQDAIEAVSKDDGWAALSSVGQYISKNNPAFASRNHGFQRLGELMESLKTVEARYVETGGHKNMHVRLKSRSH